MQILQLGLNLLQWDWEGWGQDVTRRGSCIWPRGLTGGYDLDMVATVLRFCVWHLPLQNQKPTVTTGGWNSVITRTFPVGWSVGEPSYIQKVAWNQNKLGVLQKCSWKYFSHIELSLLKREEILKSSVWVLLPCLAHRYMTKLSFPLKFISFDLYLYFLIHLSSPFFLYNTV